MDRIDGNDINLNCCLYRIGVFTVVVISMIFIPGVVVDIIYLIYGQTTFGLN